MKKRLDGFDDMTIDFGAAPLTVAAVSGAVQAFTPVNGTIDDTGMIWFDPSLPAGVSLSYQVTVDPIMAAADALHAGQVVPHQTVMLANGTTFTT